MIKTYAKNIHIEYFEEKYSKNTDNHSY